jgi:hypothetical protein
MKKDELFILGGAVWYAFAGFILLSLAIWLLFTDTLQTFFRLLYIICLVIVCIEYYEIVFKLYGKYVIQKQINKIKEYGRKV